MRFSIIAFTLLWFASCTNNQVEQEKDGTPEKTIIAFGSCANQELENPVWGAVMKHNPDVFIWLGDNIYGDSEDPDVLAEKYQRQKRQPAYRRFLESRTTIIGTWDDHDYGADDAGKEYPAKAESKDLMLDFFDVPEDATVRNHPGVYQSYTFGKEGQRVKVILLDTRWFRDELLPDTTAPRGYLPSLQGTILGEDQWQWFEQEITNADAEVLIIGSSVQALSAEHGWEKWANFPNERERLFNLLARSKAKKTVIISGDRHQAEVSRIKNGETWLYDVTTSGMTHVFARPEVEPNALRISPLIIRRNWALFEIIWNSPEPVINVDIRGVSDTLYYQHQLER